jgi:prepilin-type N-terminal cleavage/methylation domain-containing protein
MVVQQGVAEMENNRKGFGLVEVVIASLVLGIVALGLITATDFFSKSKITRAQDGAFLRLVQGVELIFSSKASCEGNLFAKAIPASNSLSLNSLGVYQDGILTNPTLFARLSDGTRPTFFLGQIEVISLTLVSRGFVTSVAPFKERFELELVARRPLGSGALGGSEFRRFFEVLAEVTSNAPGRTVVECLFPGALGTPTSISLQSICEDKLGGEFNTVTNTCDIRPAICQLFGVGTEASGRCDRAQLRRAFMAPMFGEYGSCNSDEVMKGFRLDGTPICGNASAGSVVYDVGILDPATCGECFVNSAVPCYAGAAPNPTTAEKRFLIYRGGVYSRSQCGVTPGVPRCASTNLTARCP